ncbi:hypothetical protein [Hoeflea sp.]|uniref:hypothetical protein n=1 Tax=Hoeflea sp. TaxID=1940281 RepID=UPI001986F67F|nr:hypothetical protein [Hoeflea sp.]MBC7282296.1 hypothetical protein [Hoeflea sp.]
MVLTRLRTMLLAALALLLLQGPGSLAQSIEDMALSDEEFGEAYDIFPSDIDTIYLDGTVTGMDGSVEISATWIAVDVAGVSADFAFLNLAAEITPGNDVFHFATDRPDDGWPVGDYRVDVAMNGETVETLAFSIEAATADAGDGAADAQGAPLPSPASATSAAITLEQTILSDSEIGGSVGAFAPDTAVLHPRSNIHDAPAGTAFTVSWLAADVPGIEKGLLIDSTDLVAGAGMTTLKSQLSRPDAGWPVGRYSVTIAVAGRILEAVTFDIATKQDLERGAQAASDASLSEVLLSLSKAGSPVETIRAADRRLYLTMRAENAAAKTRVRASLVVVHAGDVPDGYVVLEQELEVLDGMDALTYEFSGPDQGWPTGLYRIDLSINGRPAGNVPFGVEP